MQNLKTRLKDFAPALKHIADIIERGIREHPELSVGMQTEGIEVSEQAFKVKVEKPACIFSHQTVSIAGEECREHVDTP